MSLPTTTQSLSGNDGNCQRCGENRGENPGENQGREILTSRRAKSTKTAPPRDNIDPYQPSIESYMTTTTGKLQTCYSNLTKASLHCYNL